MSANERVYWDRHYHRLSIHPYPPPDPLLFEHVLPVSGDADYRALDVAAGYAQNGLWVATQGYIVDAVDISRVALQRARERAELQTIRTVNFHAVDLDVYTLPRETYDLVCVFRFLKRPLMPQVRACVRPGGRIIYQVHNQDSGEDSPYTISKGELSGYFADWQILLNDDLRGLSRLVALKPT